MLELEVWLCTGEVTKCTRLSVSSSNWFRATEIPWSSAANAALPRYHKAILIPNSYWPSRNKTLEYQPPSLMISPLSSPPAAVLHGAFRVLNVIATFVKQVKSELRKWIHTLAHIFVLKFTRSAVHSCFNNPSKTRDLIGRSSMSN